MALRLAVAADAPAISTARNAWCKLRPDIYGTELYSPEQALVDINHPRQRVFVYTTTGSTLRGYMIVQESVYPDPDTGTSSLALRIGALAIDPAIFSTANLQTAMQTLKQWALNNRAILRRLVGDIVEPSPFFTYAKALGYRFIVSATNPDGTTSHTIDRVLTASTG